MKCQILLSFKNNNGTVLFSALREKISGVAGVCVCGGAGNGKLALFDGCNSEDPN